MNSLLPAVQPSFLQKPVLIVVAWKPSDFHSSLSENYTIDSTVLFVSRNIDYCGYPRPNLGEELEGEGVNTLPELSQAF